GKVADAFASAGKVQIPSGSSQLLVSSDRATKTWCVTDLTKMRHYQLKRRDDKQIDASLEAQFYFAPQATAVGTLTFPQGFYVNGAIELLGYRAEATVDISQGRGIKID